MNINKAMTKFYKEIGNMALNDGDKAMCAEIAREIIKEVIKEHVDTCPHGIKMRYGWKMAAALFLIVALGSGVGPHIGTIIKLFM